MKQRIALIAVLVLAAGAGGFFVGRAMGDRATERWHRGVASADQPYLVWWGYPPVFFPTRELADTFIARNAEFNRPEDALTPAQREELLRQGRVLYPEAVRR